MVLGEYLEEKLRVYVWSGFYGRDEILECLQELAFSEGEPIEAETLTRLVDQEILTKREAEKAWPGLTDCDKLDLVFSQLEVENVIALQNAGFTQSDGFQNCCHEFSRRGPNQGAVVGFCFYTFQDLERAVGGYGLNLGFGAASGEAEPSIAVGLIIVKLLLEQGFEVEWDGTIERRLQVKTLDWKRRGPVIDSSYPAARRDSGSGG